MGSEQQHQHRFPLQERPKRWGGCFGPLRCFRSQKGGGKRIVPHQNGPHSISNATQQNGPHHNSNQATSLLAPPSSPASFSNSALPSTAQSPNCFLSANSPGCPSNTMYATGPYAHETQLVSPPVFSAFTTEPSTAPFTPPPELAHLTTPSSPDVPYARFLISSMGLKNNEKTNYNSATDLHSTYSLYPGSPALRSPISMTSGDCLSSSFPNREFVPQWGPSISPPTEQNSRTGSGRLFGNGTTDSNFFCPETFAQFYQDAPFPYAGGRLSVSNDSDVNPNQNRPIRSPKQDVEELEAYRASFGFSADDIITTNQYVEITDVMNDSFTMAPIISDKHDGQKGHGIHTNLLRHSSFESESVLIDEGSCHESEDHKLRGSKPVDHIRAEEDIFAKMGLSKTNSRKYMSNSDAEIDYRSKASVIFVICFCFGILGGIRHNLIFLIDES
ncbi:hypothetical protein ACFE04_014696 [Oxalis oulophora]